MAAWRPPEDEEVAWVLEVVGCKRSHLGDMSEDEFRYLLKPRRWQVALALHPDKQPGGRRGMAETQMKRWNVAWERVMHSVPPQFKAAGAGVTPARTQAALNAHPGMWKEPWCVPASLVRQWKQRGAGHQESESGDGVPSGSQQPGAQSAQQGTGAGATSSDGGMPSASAGTDPEGDAGTSQSNSTNASDPCAGTPHCVDFDTKHRGIPAQKLLEYKFLYSAHGKCVRCMGYYARQPGLDVTCKSCNMNAREWAASSTGRKKRTTVPIPDDVERWLQRHNL